MELWFSIQIAWKISPETNQSPVKLEFMDLPHGKLAKIAQNRPNAPLKNAPKIVPLARNYLPLLGYDEWNYGFQFRSPGKFHLKPTKAL